MTVKLTGDVMRDTQIFAQEAFRAMRDPDEDLLAVLLFWREAKLTHVEALDDAHFVDDAAKSNLFERVVTRLIRERSPEVVSLATPTRSGVGTASEDEVLVTVVGKTFVTMTRATVQRRIDASRTWYMETLPGFARLRSQELDQRCAPFGIGECALATGTHSSFSDAIEAGARRCSAASGQSRRYTQVEFLSRARMRVRGLR